MELDERKKEILRAAIDSYVDTAEPVGSKFLASGGSLRVSAATIRSEMAELESLGLLEQPHTSAGRVPTPAGYRVYVNELMREHKLSLADMETVNRAMRKRISELDKLLDDTGRLVSNLTSYPAYAAASPRGGATISRYDFIGVDNNTFIALVMLGGETVKNKLIHSTAPVSPAFLTRLSALFNASFTGIAEDAMTATLISATERAAGDSAGIVAVVAGFSIEMLMEAKQMQPRLSGALSLFDYPEYRDIGKARRVIRYLSDERNPAKLPAPARGGDVKITIGPENLAEELRDSSVVVASCDAGADIRVMVGVVGPTRMDYSKVTSRLEYIARALGWLLSQGGEGNLLLGGPDEGQMDVLEGDEDFERN
ncbi:MAG: heat-inducible transcriptional repressor HrcA [Oscillospiraceae bacterium]|jgi:heat-inducible transcriptional repressor|nr:heat-inducible transcriptional repressor HrcA [Oscillospiraceae bacterium]